MPHVLIIEDDHDLTTVLQHDLQDAGYHTTHANSVIQGLTLAREQIPDLVLLDLTLPDGNGRDVLIRLKNTIGIRVIVITAHDTTEEKVELLNLGASDYIVKPYNLDELLARITVQLRASFSDVLTVRDLHLCPAKRLVTRGRQEVRFGPKEFDILELLMRHPGRVYSRANILDAVWEPENAPSSNLVDVHLANIRSKLRAAGLHGLLRTVRGVGYALKA